MLQEIDIYEYLTLLSLIIVIIKKIVGFNNLNHFLIFLLIVNLFDLIISYFIAKNYKSNVFVTNIYACLCISFYWFFFMQELLKKSLKNKLKMLFILWLIFGLIRVFILDSFYSIDFITYDIGMFIVSYIIFKFLYQIIIYSFQIPKILYKVILGFGILLFFTACFPLITLSNILIINEEVTEAYQDLLQIGNIFLSLGYLGAAICIRKEAKSTI